MKERAAYLLATILAATLTAVEASLADSDWPVAVIAGALIFGSGITATAAYYHNRPTTEPDAEPEPWGDEEDGPSPVIDV